jgi:saccharopine dehydrogenase-like NADP-dependent oxidoreductase
MENILIVGAGKSSTYLIKYLIEQVSKLRWKLTIADANPISIREKTGATEFATIVELDINNETERRNLVKQHDIIVSLMPAHLHVLLAKDCLDFAKHLVTASYVSDEMRSFDEAARKKGVVFMCELGLDPGIDHMSALQVIHSIEKRGGVVHGFKSHCGGLVAPQSDNNPWHYKISWNPRNVVVAGKSGADYLLENKVKHVPYTELFADAPTTYIKGFGELAYYPNRDSLSYKDLYNLRHCHTFVRTTLRYPEYCKGWNAVIHLGLTDEDKVFDTSNMTYGQWVAAQAAVAGNGNVMQAVSDQFPQYDAQTMDMLNWLGIFDENKLINLGAANSAGIMQSIIEKKWKMQPDDADMVVMQHEFEYERRGLNTRMISTMVLKGIDQYRTAMSRTVGLPMAAFTKLLASGKMEGLVGVQIPTSPEVYKPVLKELETQGVSFVETFEE